jgi:hypothetical protein
MHALVYTQATKSSLNGKIWAWFLPVAGEMVFRGGERFLSYFLLHKRIFSGFAGSAENRRILIAPRIEEAEGDRLI